MGEDYQMNTPKPTDDGGDAFPRAATSYNGSQQGMSLRDYFAGQALGFIIQQPMAVNNITYDSSARDAYRYADAMIAARKEKP